MNVDDKGSEEFKFNPRLLRSLPNDRVFKSWSVIRMTPNNPNSPYASFMASPSFENWFWKGCRWPPLWFTTDCWWRECWWCWCWLLLCWWCWWFPSWLAEALDGVNPSLLLLLLNAECREGNASSIFWGIFACMFKMSAIPDSFAGAGEKDDENDCCREWTVPPLFKAFLKLAETFEYDFSAADPASILWWCTWDDEARFCMKDEAEAGPLEVEDPIKIEVIDFNERSTYLRIQAGLENRLPRSMQHFHLRAAN